MKIIESMHLNAFETQRTAAYATSIAHYPHRHKELQEIKTTEKNIQIICRKLIGMGKTVFVCGQYALHVHELGSCYTDAHASRLWLIFLCSLAWNASLDNLSVSRRSSSGSHGYQPAMESCTQPRDPDICKNVGFAQFVHFIAIFLSSSSTQLLYNHLILNLKPNACRASDIKVDIHWSVDLYYPAWEKRHLLFWDGLHLNSKVSK